MVFQRLGNETSLLFNLLKRRYGKRYPWIEVREFLKRERISSEDFYDPFKNLIIGILSQNTSDRNSVRAYVSLAKRFKITPSSLARGKEKEIEEAIRIGGLYRIKGRRIRELAKLVLRKFDGDLKKLLKLPKGEVRKILLQFPGIGDKTADVFLAYCCKADVIPIDTNIARVAKRLGLVPRKAGYKEIQEAWMKVIPRGMRRRGHELLIRLGRDYCKARNPNCKECPLLKICPYSKT